MRALPIVGFLFGLPFGFALLGSAAFARPPPGELRHRVVRISGADIPRDFDSNSDAFVMTAGWLPNSCYRAVRVEVAQRAPLLHEITAKADVTAGLCLAVIITWRLKVELGRLEAGTHVLRFINGDGTYQERRIVIQAPSSLGE